MIYMIHNKRKQNIYIYTYLNFSGVFVSSFSSWHLTISALEALARSPYPCPQRLEALKPTCDLSSPNASMVTGLQRMRMTESKWEMLFVWCARLCDDIFYVYVYPQHCQSLQFVLRELCCQSFAT